MRGLATSPGIGMGKAFLYRDLEIQIQKQFIESEEDEIQRFYRAIEQAKSEIDNLYHNCSHSLGEDESKIFSAHRMMLEDPEFIGKVDKKIRKEKINAEWALNEITNGLISIFDNIEDKYLRGRVIDIKDVTKRVLRLLLKIESMDLGYIEKASIVIAEDLTPSDTAQMEKKNVKGIITELGGKNSHTSIIARKMEIPAIIGVKDILDLVETGDYLILDGYTGEIIINPSEKEKNSYKKRQEDIIEDKIKFEKVIGKDSISKDGHRIEISGNIGSLEDIDEVIENDGQGVGLFRTEYIYINRKSLPTEEEQFEIYKSAGEKLQEKPLIIRTLDVGGDKEIPCLDLPEEMNPFLGYRGIRISLDRLDIFKTQLRAILRASYYGNIKIMFPMISSIEELKEVKTIFKEIKKSLKSENIPFNEDIEMGIMVEVPAVAIHSKAFAKEVDFFSIGTNDLIQYTLAVDRGSRKIAQLYTQYHPAVLRLIKMTIENGHKAGISVSMCGEMAGDENIIPILLAMGLDKFSMNASSILRSKYLIRNISIDEISKKTMNLLDLPTSEDVKQFIDEIINVKLP